MPLAVATPPFASQLIPTRRQFLRVAPPSASSRKDPQIERPIDLRERRDGDDDE
jgi:hypothetical protein